MDIHILTIRVKTNIAPSHLTKDKLNILFCCMGLFYSYSPKNDFFYDFFLFRNITVSSNYLTLTYPKYLQNFV